MSTKALARAKVCLQPLPAEAQNRGMFGETQEQLALTARRLRRRRSQHRTRWLFLLASGTLIVGFSTCLVLCFSGQSYAETPVVDDFKAASEWNPTDPGKVAHASQGGSRKGFPEAMGEE